MGIASILNHFLLPDGNVQICLSGGRTSAYMLHQILEANGGLPDRCVVTFQNTGREMPQTLDFVQEIERRWNVVIVWLEYRAEKPFFEVVSHNSASRNGEPFEALIWRRKYLPNQASRFCTIELKIRTAKRYLVSQGWKEWTNCIGIRRDEPKRFRDENDKAKDRWYTYQPLYHAGVTNRDVAQFWRDQDFDLQLENINGKTPLGNCDGCFLKSEANLASLARDYPERHQWWEDMEGLASNLTASPMGARFRKEFTRAELGDFVKRQGDWVFDQDGMFCQEDDGECV